MNRAFRQVIGRVAALLMVSVAMSSGHAAAEDAPAVIAQAVRAMGAEGLDSIALAGTAAYGNIGQSRTISFGLASTTVANFTRAIDFAHSTMHTTGVAGSPAVRGNPAPGLFEERVTAADGWASQLEIWTSPWGFVLGAAAHHGTVRNQTIDGVRFTVIAWVPPFKSPSGQPYRVVGYLNSQHLVERVETWVEHPIFGDMHVEQRYSNYQDVGGVKVPGRIAQRRMAMETFVALVSKVNANPANLADLMAPAGGPAPAAPRPVSLSSDRLAEDVYRITGDYVALVVGLKNFVVVLGGGSSCGVSACSPQESEQLGRAMLAETKRLFPRKPVRFIVNTHPHFDHAAMLPPFAAEGITILTDDPNRYFLEQALSQPRTLVGDALAKSGKKPVVRGVEEVLVLGDESRRIELHHLVRVEHSDGMLLAYLPQEKLLFAGDIDVPAPGEAPGASLLSLLQNVDRLKLDFDSYLTTTPDPGQPITRAALAARLQQAD